MPGLEVVGVRRVPDGEAKVGDGRRPVDLRVQVSEAAGDAVAQQAAGVWVKHDGRTGGSGGGCPARCTV